MGYWNRTSPLNQATDTVAYILAALLPPPLPPYPRAMAEEPAKESDAGEGGAAVAEPEAPAQQPKRKSRSDTKPRPKKPPTKQLPPWKVLLHNDDVNTFEHVIISILDLTPLKELDAIKATEEAHRSGVALLLVTHRERAELFVEQFQTKKLKVTCEPAE